MPHSKPLDALGWGWREGQRSPPQSSSAPVQRRPQAYASQGALLPSVGEDARRDVTGATNRGPSAPVPRSAAAGAALAANFLKLQRLYAVDERQQYSPTMTSRNRLEASAVVATTATTRSDLQDTEDPRRQHHHHHRRQQQLLLSPQYASASAPERTQGTEVALLEARARAVAGARARAAARAEEAAEEDRLRRIVEAAEAERLRRAEEAAEAERVRIAEEDAEARRLRRAAAEALRAAEREEEEEREMMRARREEVEVRRRIKERADAEAQEAEARRRRSEALARARAEAIRKRALAEEQERARLKAKLGAEEREVEREQEREQAVAEERQRQFLEIAVRTALRFRDRRTAFEETRDYQFLQELGVAEPRRFVAKVLERDGAQRRQRQQDEEANREEREGGGGETEAAEAARDPEARGRRGQNNDAVPEEATSGDQGMISPIMGEAQMQQMPRGRIQDSTSASSNGAGSRNLVPQDQPDHEERTPATRPAPVVIPAEVPVVTLPPMPMPTTKTGNKRSIELKQSPKTVPASPPKRRRVEQEARQELRQAKVQVPLPPPLVPNRPRQNIKDKASSSHQQRPSPPSAGEAADKLRQNKGAAATSGSSVQEDSPLAQLSRVAAAVAALAPVPQVKADGDRGRVADQPSPLPRQVSVSQFHDEKERPPVVAARQVPSSSKPAFVSAERRPNVKETRAPPPTPPHKMPVPQPKAAKANCRGGGAAAKHPRPNAGPLSKPQQQQQPSSPPESPLPRRRTRTQPARQAELDQRWRDMADKLLEYKKEYGHVVVPRFHYDVRLAAWVMEQRKHYRLLRQGKTTTLSHARLKVLNDMGFVWNAQDFGWRRKYGQLKSYRERHGHVNVPLECKEFPGLGKWVKEQRRDYALPATDSPMVPERIALLEDVGFVWDTADALWWESYQELKAYKKRHGHCEVPREGGGTQQFMLATWIDTQRRQFREMVLSGGWKDKVVETKGEGETLGVDPARGEGLPAQDLTRERMEALDELDFNWNGPNKGRGGGRGAAALPLRAASAAAKVTSQPEVVPCKKSIVSLDL